MKNIKFHLTIYKGGRPVKRQSYAQSYFLVGPFTHSSLVLKDAKGESRLSGLFYWKDKAQFVFRNFKTKNEQVLSRDSSSAEPQLGTDGVHSQNDRVQAQYELNQGDFKIQLVSTCVGDPPEIDFAQVIANKSQKVMSAKAKTQLSEFQHRSKLAVYSVIGLLILGGLWIPFHYAKKEIVSVRVSTPEMAATAVEPKPAHVRIDQKYFYRVLKNNKQEIELCQYEHEFKDGLVKYKAMINEKGEMKQLLVLSQDVESQNLLKCIEEKITHWKFPQTLISENTVFFTLALKSE